MADNRLFMHSEPRRGNKPARAVVPTGRAMPADNLRRRLAALNRERLPGRGVATRAALCHGVSRPASTTRPTAPDPAMEIAAPESSPSAARTLEDVAPGEVVDNPRGRFLCWRRPLAELWSECDEFVDAYRRTLDERAAAGDREARHPDLAEALAGASAGLLYMDSETTGLAGSPVFLIGLMHLANDGFRIEQLLARDYSEEAAMLHHYHERIPQFRALVTFNGKSFDVPCVTDRSYATGLGPPPAPAAHLDVLHAARRRWKGRFANCKLQTLETNICRRRRVGDIPGDQIPQAYHDFVRTGDATQMKDILHHNALDLLTMAQLLAAMLEGKRA